MAAPLVITTAIEGINLGGQLFQGKKFFVAQRTPSRLHYLEQIKSNGGEIVALEKHADFLIADHARAKGAHAGSISYQFIEESIKKGQVQDPTRYAIGPLKGTVPQAGFSRSLKSFRTRFTVDDDRILWNWVQDYVKKGGTVGGNKIYEQLAAVNPRHTAQSWRDRYLKHLQYHPPTGSVPMDAQSHLPSEQSAEQLPSNQASVRLSTAPNTRIENNWVSGVVQESSSEEISMLGKSTQLRNYTIADLQAIFDDSDYEEVYANVPGILDCTVGKYLQGWEDWAKGTPQSAELWKQYYEKIVLPNWRRDPQGKRDKIKRKVHNRHTRERQAKSPAASEKSIKRKHSLDGPSEPGSNSDPLLTKRIRQENLSSGGRQKIGIPQEDDPEKEPVVISDAERSSLSGKEEPVNGENAQPSEDEDYNQQELQNPEDENSTPRPGPIGFRAALYDTQAILLSPSQTIDLGLAPLPPGFSQSDGGSPSPTSSRASSSTRRPDSVSTSFSIQEFRRSFTEADAAPVNQREQSPLIEMAPIALPDVESDSETDSPSSSSDLDPDPPLAGLEIGEFFEEQQEEGYSTEEIALALGHTTLRPELAKLVLEELKAGRPLPDQRGIWTKEDDEKARYGGPRELRALQLKHTVDGWGGISEREKYLRRFS
ncbi:hypothetical protein GQ43DRAFT_462091 [Delitschia confertaspora ATCC 74209]|uniref:DNA-binding protein RAP1 n=1 Tax=Delitschia confertaspora ATCC 74209 TaxID=1513339 RepID=A0A9P4JR23_9PLEO|nr:hypothetical protein GQ43DRAFT_462091 [Delitschia confertaspora ATCC 74209]